MPLPRRSRPEVNASSMADIAFLLLVFFLVTTEITEESGVLVRLPPYEPDTELPPFAPRNVFRVLVNGDDALLVRGESAPLAALRGRVKDFVANPAGDPALARSPRRAVVSLQTDRRTSYRRYLGVFNELQAAYRELWDAEARRRFGVTAYEALDAERRRAIRGVIPQVISEAEPYGGS